MSVTTKGSHIIKIFQRSLLPLPCQKFVFSMDPWIGCVVLMLLTFPNDVGYCKGPRYIKPICLTTKEMLWEVQGHHFGYAKTHQKTWKEKHASCGGKWQSPVPIAAEQAVRLPLRALETAGYHDPLPPPITMVNNGHSVSLRAGYSQDPPRVFGAMLKHSYVLDSFHFHWGLRNYRGSEHRLNGIRYPMEMHLVHYRSSYRNLTEALQHDDGLVVLAFFFRLTERDNRKLGPLVERLPAVKWVGRETRLDYFPTLASLLPRDRDIFYTYRGSLTTPPCSEVVTWFVFPEPQAISFTQMKKFRKLSSGSKKKLVDNYRALQPLGERIVYVRDLESTAKPNCNLTDLPWFRSNSITGIALPE